MCGVFGWVSTQDRDDSAQIMRRALHALERRGPDAEGAWQGRHPSGVQVAFGHRRLSIIDLCTGDQPMWSLDKRFVITFNGEIYNYVELAEQLKARGHVFATSSDTEVVLEAYRAWGPSFVEHLRGMFAFALFDTVEGVAVLARDPFGKKPLFLADIPGGVAFASEIPPLLAIPGVSSAIRESAIAEYMLLRYVSGPETMFSAIRKLPPGHLQVWRGGGFEQRRYFTPPFLTVRPEPMSMGQAVERFSSAFDEAVRIRMRSDAPFGAYLSGGLDSSLVVAAMSRHSSEPIKTFSVGFDDRRLSELKYAAMVVADFRTEHTEVVVDSSAFLDHWADAVKHRAAPVSEASDIPILLLSRQAGRTVKMVLTGEGADELLGGYPKYRAEPYIRWYQTLIKPPVHRAIVAPLISALPYRFRRLKVLSSALAASSFREREATWFASGSIESIRSLVSMPLTVVNPSDAFDLPPWMSASRALQLNDQLAWLSDNLLERGDRMMMAGSVEGRMPFMDVKLATVVASLPDRFLSGGRGKLVAREMAKTLLRPETIRRRKIGFEVPLGAWFRNELRDEVQDLLLSANSEVRTYLDRKALGELVQLHMSGRQDLSKVLWAAANLEIFLRQTRAASDAKVAAAVPVQAVSAAAR